MNSQIEFHRNSWRIFNIHRKGGEIVYIFEFESERIWAEEVLPILQKLSDEDRQEVIASIDAYIFELNKESKW